MIPNLAFPRAAFARSSRDLLREGRLTGPMPWIIAIMMFLTVIAAATGLGLVNASQAMDARLENRLTIQLIDGDADARAADTRRVVAEVARLPGVAAVVPVPRAELARLLEPYLGADGLDRELPMPVLIDVDMAASDGVTAGLVEAAVARIAPAARVDRHAQWLAPVSRLFGWLTGLAAMMVLLMAVATGAAVVLAARGALNTHGSTIEVLHMMGATDGQVAGLFQRRIALDSLFGGLIGLAAALIVVIAFGSRVAGLESELASNIHLGAIDWLKVALLPVAFALLAMLAARVTILAALRRTL